MKITKIFVQTHEPLDCEGRNYEWRDADESYEELAQRLAAAYTFDFDAVRLIDKTCDENFKITKKVLKITEQAHDENWEWSGAVETVF